MAKRVYDEKWLREYNKKRKARYAQDRNYRVQVQEANLSSYRKRATVATPKINVREVISHGTSRPVEQGENRHVTMLCFTVEELAKALGGTNPSTLYRWIKANLLPYPGHTAIVHGQPVGVYLPKEATTIAEILKTHYLKKAYLRKTDSATVIRLFRAVQ